MSRSRTLRHRTARRVVWVAWLCVVAQLGLLAHLIVERHGRCAEHGEQVHLDDRGGSLAELVAAALDESTTLRAHPLQRADHDDDHCPVALQPTTRPPTAVLIAHLVAPAPRIATPPPHTPDGTSRPLYRLAPKVSPPLA